MKRLSILLGTLLLAIQWPLWMGHGGWFRVWDLQHQLADRLALNEAYRVRNQVLTAEISSLLRGTEAIEERARNELHMMRRDETFFQFRAPAGAANEASDASEASRAGAGKVASSEPLELRSE